MPSWEEIKRAGQTAFSFNNPHESVSSLYQQILSTGHVPSLDENLTQQIAGGHFPEPEAAPSEITRTIEPEQDVEPER